MKKKITVESDLKVEYNRLGYARKVSEFVSGFIAWLRHIWKSGDENAIISVVIDEKEIEGILSLPYEDTDDLDYSNKSTESRPSDV